MVGSDGVAVSLGVLTSSLGTPFGDDLLTPQWLSGLPSSCAANERLGGGPAGEQSDTAGRVRDGEQLVTGVNIEPTTQLGGQDEAPASLETDDHTHGPQHARLAHAAP